MISRYVATKFVNDICNTLNLDLTNLLALFTGTLYVIDGMISKFYV